MSSALARYAAFPLALAGTLLVVAGGCHLIPEACTASCLVSESETFHLACSPTDLTSVSVTGPCAGDGGTSEGHFLIVSSLTPGVCHVTLTFASGFVFATDVTFTAQTEDTGNCPPCPPYVGPAQGPIDVDNPPSTCVDGETADDAPTGDGRAGP